MVSGSLRATDTLYSTTAQFQILRAPTASNGTTYGPGTANNLLKSNGNSIYWTALSASDIPNLNTSKLTEGVLGVTRGGTGSATTGANTVFAGPSSGTTNAAPNFRSLVSADIPTLSITDKTSGTLTVARGGTGATDAAGARTNLGVKALQNNVSSPTASGNSISYIDTISQNTQGVISATKKTIPEVTQSESGLMIPDDKIKLDDIGTKKQVKTVSIEPVQSGSGDPSPDNVRPISGWTGANVTRTGKNLSSTASPATSAVVVKFGDFVHFDSLTFSFTLDNATIAKKTSAVFRYKKHDGTTGYLGAGDFHDVENPNVTINSLSSPYTGRFTYTLTNIEFEEIEYCNWSGISAMTEFQIEKGSSTTAYEPYQGNIYSIQFPSEAGTVYGGTLKINENGTGELTSNLVSTTFGALTGGSWRYQGQYSRFYYTKAIGINSGYINSSIIGSRLGISRPGLFLDSLGRVFAVTDIASSVDDFLEIAADKQLVYELATPQTYQLTPTEVLLLTNEDNVWADTGEVTLQSYLTNNATNVVGVIDVSHGGTSATTASEALLNLGAAAVNHTHNYAGSSSAGGSANSVANSLTLKINTPSTETEGTNTYTFNGSASKTLDIKAGSNISLTASAGTVTIANTYSYNLPTAATETKGGIKVGSGLTMNGEILNHSNSITAQTTQALYPIKIDAQGHISSYGEAITPVTTSGGTMTGLLTISHSNARTIYNDGTRDILWIGKSNATNASLGLHSLGYYNADGTWTADAAYIAYRASGGDIYLNGRANSLPDRTLTIGSTGKTFNGTGNVSWSLAEIGATVSNTWTNGTTAGPTIKTTVNGVTGTAVTIPSASSTQSGIVTTGEQAFRGLKYFDANAIAIRTVGDTLWPCINFGSIATIGNNYTNTDQDTWNQLFTQNAGKRNSDNKYYKNRFFFRSFSDNGSGGRTEFYEDYYLPEADSNRTNSESYTILTNKNLNFNITGNAANVTGVVNVTNGGTGANTPAGAKNNLGLGSAAMDFSVVNYQGDYQYWGIDAVVQNNSNGTRSTDILNKRMALIIQSNGILCHNATDDSGVWALHIVLSKPVSGSTDANGNINLGISADNFIVIGIKINSYIATPWVSGTDNNWHARITGISGTAHASTEITATVYYKSVPYVE